MRPLQSDQNTAFLMDIRREVGEIFQPLEGFKNRRGGPGGWICQLPREIPPFTILVPLMTLSAIVTGLFSEFLPFMELLDETPCANPELNNVLLNPFVVKAAGNYRATFKLFSDIIFYSGVSFLPVLWITDTLGGRNHFVHVSIFMLTTIFIFTLINLGTIYALPPSQIALSEYGNQVIKDHRCNRDASPPICDTQKALATCVSLINTNHSRIELAKVTCIIETLVTGIPLLFSLLALRYNEVIPQIQAQSAARLSDEFDHEVERLRHNLVQITRRPDQLPADTALLQTDTMTDVLNQLRLLPNHHQLDTDVQGSLTNLIQNLANQPNFHDFTMTLSCPLLVNFPLLAVILVASTPGDATHPNIVDVSQISEYLFSNQQIRLNPIEIVSGKMVNSPRRFGLGNEPGHYKFIPLHPILAELSVVDRLISGSATGADAVTGPDAV